MKITKPPGFGLIPRVKSFRVPNIREPDSDTYRQAIEFERATPLEYLERWICSNEVFEDDVRLASVVAWADQTVSFVIRQPHYGGRPTTQRDIDSYFEECKWSHLKRETNHTVYFNYAFGVLAIDAVPRNCYRSEDGLNPFDVILCRPDEELEKYLEIYPD